MIYNSGGGGSSGRIGEVMRRAVLGSGGVAGAVKDALARIERVERAEVSAEALADVTDTIGEVHAGAWVASDQDPEETGFSGTVISWPAVTINGRTYTLYGMNNGILQFGLDALTGRALAGGGTVVLDSRGLVLFGTDSAGDPIFVFRRSISGSDVDYGFLWPNYSDADDDVQVQLTAYRPSAYPVDIQDATVYIAADDGVTGTGAYLGVSSQDRMFGRFTDIRLGVGAENSEALAANVSAGGAVDVGTHLYGWTITTQYGETPIDWDSVIAVTTTPGNQTVNLTVPKAHKLGHGRRVYRRAASGGVWRRVAEIADTETTNTYQDTASNASIASSATPLGRDTSGVFMLENSARMANATGYDLIGSAPLPTPAAPSATLVPTSTGNMVNGRHRYRVRFYHFTENGSAISAWSADSNEVTVDDTHKQVTVTLPVMPGMYRYLYRTDADSDNWRVLAWIGSDWETTYTDSFDDEYQNAGGLSFQNFEEAIGGMPGLPRYAFWLFSAMYPSTNMTSTIDTGQYMNYYTAQVTPSNGDNWWHNVFLDRGDYVIKTYGRRTTGSGLLEVRIDGRLVTSPAWDLYGGSTIKNNFETASFTLDHPGFHLVQFRVNGRNPSSSGYAVQLTMCQIVPANEWGQ